MKAANGRPSLVAVHADRREGDLAVMPQETLDLWKATGSGDQTVAAAAGVSAEQVKRPWSLFPVILGLLIAVALAESVVANGYLRADRQGSETRQEAPST